MIKPLKIGYFADGPWAHEAFKKIQADSTLKIVFLTVRYDKRDPVLLAMAEKEEIPAIFHKDINADDAVAEFESYGADLFVSMSFNQIFKKQIMNVPPLKVMNCHAGALPFYRGRNILNWALINDEKTFGITVHYVDEGIDTGDIILQRLYPISDHDDYSTLLARSYKYCADILYDAIKLIQAGEVAVIKQSEIDPVGMYCGIRKPGDELLDWDQSSRDVFNFVRALCKPGPRARSFINGNEILINRVKEIKGMRPYKNTAGQVLGRSEDGFIVKTKDTAVEVLDYEYSGRIRVGDRLIGRLK